MDRYNEQLAQEIQDGIEHSQKLKRLARNYKSTQGRRNTRLQEQMIIWGDAEHPILTEGSINILSGPSGTGKSTFIIQAMRAIADGNPIFGLPTRNVPFVHIFDGSDTDLQRMLNAMGYGDWDYPGKSVEEISEDFDLDIKLITLPMILRCFEWPTLYIVEAYKSFLRPQSTATDYQDTMADLREVRKALGHTKSFLGVTHDAKMLLGQKYANVRERAHGTVAQGAMASTVINMGEGEREGEVLIQLAPRHCKGFTAKCRLWEGKKLEDYEIVELKRHKERSRAFNLMDQLLRSARSDSIIPMRTLEAWGQELQLNRATVYRWRDARLEDGTLRQVRHGVYMKAQEQ